MKPQIVLDFERKDQRDRFVREYGDDVLSILRISANDANPTETLRFELPPLADYGYRDTKTGMKFKIIHGERVPEGEEVEKKFAIFVKGKEIENRPPIWVYYFKKII